MSTEQAAANETVSKEAQIVEIIDSNNIDNIQNPDTEDTSPQEPKIPYDSADESNNSIPSDTSRSLHESDKTIPIKSAQTGSKTDHTSSGSFHRVISNTVRYKIPHTVSKTRLKDTIQPGYLLVWLFAILLSSMVVIGDWAIVKALSVNICTVDNNYDGDLLSVDFMSWNSIAGMIQQLWLVIICLGSFSLFYMPNLVGIDEDKLKISRIKLFGVMILTQVIVNIFLVPIAYNFRSIFNVLTLFLFLVWGYYEKRCFGVRRLYPLWAVIFCAVFLYYVLGGILFSSMDNSLYALVYPFYLTFAQFVLIKLLEYLDGCKCCKAGIHNEMSLEDKAGSCRRRCMKRMEFWRNTSAINEWPKFWVYYACGLVVVMSESFRIASYVVIKESVKDLLVSFTLGIISEIITRNMIHKIIWDKYIMKHTLSTPLSTAKAIYLGCKYHTDYIPVLILIACNILSFGHTNDCYYSSIAFSMDITNGYEWLIGVFIAYEFFTDMLTYLVYRVLKKFDILTQDAQDKTIKMAVVMLSRTEMFTMMLSLGYWSFVAFIYDDSSRPQQP